MHPSYRAWKINTDAVFGYRQANRLTVTSGEYSHPRNSELFTQRCRLNSFVYLKETLVYTVTRLMVRSATGLGVDAVSSHVDFFDVTW